VKLPQSGCEDWLGWIMVTLNPDAPPVSEAAGGVEKLVGIWHGELPRGFREEFRWDTNWKVLAENFMESYHLPVCHAGTIGGSVRPEPDDLPARARRRSTITGSSRTTRCRWRWRIRRTPR
jgi:phenylpropionate dioxygenase-like ring-hydroxylating dioxygenase large terminal subunit